MIKANRQTTVFLAVIFLFVLAALGATVYRSNKMGKIVFSEHLDTVIATVDETPITLKDFGIYAVYEENRVEEQARVYDETNTNKYWNGHTNGQFLRLTARDAAINLAIHDAIFYQMAMDEGIVLTDYETEYLANEQADFWNDLEEGQREKLALSKEEVDDALLKMALAQKMQQKYALDEGVENDEYEADGSAYQDMLEEHEVKKDKEFINRINFGNIILEH